MLTSLKEIHPTFPDSEARGFLSIAGEELIACFGDEMPAASLHDEWTNDTPAGDLPIIWNFKSGDNKGYNASELAWAKASPAVKRWTWTYLRVLSTLKPDFRNSYSTIAVGTAALIAAEQAAAENLAWTPTDLLEPMLIVAALETQSKGITQRLRTASSAEAITLVRNAFDSWGALKTGVAKTTDDSLESLVTKPWDAAWENQAFTLRQLVPTHPSAIDRLERAVDSTPMGAVHWMVQIVALSAKLETLTSEDSAKAWTEVQAKQTKEIKDWLKRRSMTTLLPEFKLGATLDETEPTLLRADPVVIRAVAVAATSSAFQPLMTAWREKGKGEAEKVLRECQGYKDLIALAGREPKLTLPERPTYSKGQQAIVMASVRWESMGRVHPVEGATPLYESIEIPLYSINPVGDGKPITGFQANALVVVEQNGKRVQVPAAEVIPGCRVLGHLRLGHPHEGTSVKLDGSQTEEFFTVTEVEMHRQVKRSAKLVFEGRRGADAKENVLPPTAGGTLLLALPMEIFIDTSTTGIWTATESLANGCGSWALGQRQGNLISIDNHEQPVDLIEFSLTHEDDAKAMHANNVIAFLGPQANATAVIVECRNADVAMLAETESVMQANGKPIQVGALVPNLECDPGTPKATVLKAYHERPEGNGWQYPTWRPFPTWILKTQMCTLREAVRLTITAPTGGVVPLFCSGGTPLLAWDEATHKTRLRRAATVKKGEKVVAEWQPDGETPILATIDSVELVSAPAERFVSIENVNLPVVQSTVLVRCDARARHQYNVGIASLTAAAILSKGAQPSAIAAVAKSGDEFAVGSGLPVVKAVGSIVASYDVFQKMITPTELRGVGEGVLTQMLHIHSSKASIVVAPSQALPVQGDDGRLHTSYAYQLVPGDEIFVGKAGDKSAETAKIEGIEPLFFAGVGVLELVGGPGTGFHQNLKARSDLALINEVVIFMKSGGVATTKRPQNLTPYEDAPGRGGGPYRGDNNGDSPRNSAVIGGMIARPTAPPNDAMNLPAGMDAALRDRARRIRNHFENESDKLTRISGDDALLTRLKNELGADNWPLGKDDDAATVSRTLRSWVQRCLEHRELFLQKPRRSQLPELAVEELAIAALASRAGATNTAKEFTDDLVDLGVCGAIDSTSGSGDKSPAATRARGSFLYGSAARMLDPKRDITQWSVPLPLTNGVISWSKGLQAVVGTTTIKLAPPVPKNGVLNLDELQLALAVVTNDPQPAVPTLDKADPLIEEFSQWLKSAVPPPAQAETKVKAADKK